MQIEVDPAVLFAGRNSALSNASRLQADAKLLFINGSYASSFFLVNIATEELGKYALMVSASVEAAQKKLVWKTFWKKFISHKGKTHSLLMLEDLYNFIHGASASIHDRDKNLAYALLQDELKMKSLYCDYKAGVGFSAPEQFIRREFCQLANDLLLERLDMVTLFESQVASKYSAEALVELDLEKFLQASPSASRPSPDSLGK